MNETKPFKINQKVQIKMGLYTNCIGKIVKIKPGHADYFPYKVKLPDNGKFGWYCAEELKAVAVAK